MKYIKKLKLNESETSYADSQFILRKYLLGLFSKYLILDDDIDFDLSRYSCKLTNEDDKFEYYDVYLLQIKIFSIKYALSNIHLFPNQVYIVELGNIIHRNHYMDLVTQNWKISVDYLKEKMKNNI